MQTRLNPGRALQSRRGFLRSAGAKVSAAAISSPLLARSAHAAGDDAIRIGLVGSGSRGSGAVANAFHVDPGVRLVAMADVFKDRLQSSRRLLKDRFADRVMVDDSHCFVGFDAYRKLITADVDVVLIAAASQFHPRMLKAAVEGGKHVFCEKVHAVDAPGVRLVQEACEEAKRKGLSVVSGLHRRYHAGIQETVSRVRDGAIGDIVAMEASFMNAPFSVRSRKPEWNELEWQMRNWFHFNWLSGDVIGQTLVHTLDLAAWVMDEQPPLSAFGAGGRSACFGERFGDLYDNFNVCYEYADGVRLYGFTRAQPGCYNQVTTRLQGTKGSCDLVACRIEGEKPWRLERPRAGKRPDIESPYDREQRELFASIRSGMPINNGTYMIRSSMLAVLGREVCYTGKKIAWADAIASKEKLGPDEVTWDTVPPVRPNEQGDYDCPIPGLNK